MSFSAAGARSVVQVDCNASLERYVQYLGYAYIEPLSAEAAIEFLHENFHRVRIHVNVAEFNIKDAYDILDAGATKIVVSQSQLDELRKDGQFNHYDRLIVIVEQPFDQVSEEFVLLSTLSPKIGVYFPHWKTRNLEGYPLDYGLFKVYVSLEENTRDLLERAINKGVVPVVSSSVLAIDSTEASNTLIYPAELLVLALKTDRQDGLYTTVVSDERGTCLGLVYSNSESIAETFRTGSGVYQSRKRGLWYKGATSGDTQELIRADIDCDGDALLYTVKQKGDGFCHLKTSSCFGDYSGLTKLEKTLNERKTSAPPGSYTARLFNEPKLLEAKIMEEASELCEAQSGEHIAAEAADLFYFALTRCVAAGVSLKDVERNLDAKSLKITRRKGDSKPQWTEKVGIAVPSNETVKEAASVPKSKEDDAGLKNGRIQMTRYNTSKTKPEILKEALKRPSQKSTDEIMNIVKPIVDKVRIEGDTALLEYTRRFEKATSLTSPVLNAPYSRSLMQLSEETIAAIETSFENIRRFHAAQQEEKPLQVETMPGVVCSRFSKPIESVGLYIPGGTAVLPSTALMLGVPAMVAGCKNIILASPPRADGTVTPEVVYAAHLVGAKSIVLAGGAQAVAAMAYGTEHVTKVDKILGPGNQFVTAAKMLVSNDTMARVAIDMPAGPSEVLVVADKTANPAFVAADLLSQAEHGVDSQVICIAVDLNEEQLQAIETELDKQANALPRVDIVRGAIEHSVTLVVKDIQEALTLSNEYAPEHLILQVEKAEEALGMVENAGSVFVGKWTPESVGDYSAGVNHSLPTYGYAKQYSGVNLASFMKHITSSNLTEQGLRNVGGAVMQLAKVEELEAHRRAVSIRLEAMGQR